MRSVSEPVVAQIIRRLEEAFRVHHQADCAVIDPARHDCGVRRQMAVRGHHAEDLRFRCRGWSPRRRPRRRDFAPGRRSSVRDPVSSACSTGHGSYRSGNSTRARKVRCPSAPDGFRRLAGGTFRLPPRRLSVLDASLRASTRPVEFGIADAERNFLQELGGGSQTCRHASPPDSPVDAQ